MDRHPPYAPDAESAVLGCCLSFPVECLPEAQKTITSSVFFYEPRNAVVWECLCSLKLEEVSLVTVSEKLRGQGWLDKVGGLGYLSNCQDLGIGPSFLNTWLEELLDKYTARRMLATCSEISSTVYANGTPVAQLLDAAERSILSIRPQRMQSQGIKELVGEALQAIEHRCEHGDSISGMSTGLIDLDKLTDGLHPGEMTVIAAFPSVGKTALAVNIAVHNALQGTPCAIISAEMKPVKLVVRSILSESRLNYYRLKFEDAGKIAPSASKLAKAPLYLEQASGMTIGQVVATARRLKQKHGIRIIVLDYIQLIQGRGDNREQEISSVSKGCKAMALENDAAVLALSQLTDDGKLRESRAIGQDADSVWKLENEGDWQPCIQPVRLNVEKCRDGSTGPVHLTFLKEFTRFESAAKIQPKDMPDYDPD